MIRVSLLSVAAVLAFAAGSAPSAFAKDGVYTSTTLGRNGDVTVQTTITNGRIADVKVLDWSETHPIADLPRVKVPADIVKNQSLGVDVVSGATLTSFAIINGVRDALKQAGLNPADFSKKIAPQPKLTDTVEESADIVIIGAGGAGLSAAVTAAKAGKSVIVMEKTHYAGGNTSVAGGCYNAADPALEAKQEMSPQRRASVDTLLAEPVRSKLHGELIQKVKEQLAQYDAKGGKYLFDSVELHALQSWKAGDYAGNLDLVYELAKGAPEMQKELAEMGFKWNSGTEQVVGALWPRSNRASNYKSGLGYIEQVEIPFFQAGYILPGISPEFGLPVGGRRVRAPFPEDIIIHVLRIALKCLLKPWVFRGCVVKYHIKHASHAPYVRFPDQFLHILHGAEHRIHGQIVRHIISIVILGGFEKGCKPYIINSQLPEIIQTPDHSPYITLPASVGILK